MKISNIRITKATGDTELLESEFMPLFLDVAEQVIVPLIEEALNEQKGL